ncbi:MAG TPA: sigma-54 dependent transcriptional regulator [Candidatus Omnitrophota bacterium]|nr:sigma-54 dependent transcriptional regulator [Candidatus Omnitrophota bacterium]
MTIRPSVLIVDDEKNIREGLSRFLTAKDYEVRLAENAVDAVEAMREDNPDIVLTDLKLPDQDGLFVVEMARKLLAEPIVIVFTAYGTVETAVQAMKNGAHDFLVKPVHPDALEAVLARALGNKKIRDENRDLKKELQEKQGHTNIVAESSKMQELLATVRQVAPTQSTILIQGESGSGKEVVAHLIHEWSDRKEMPFVTVHCAALNESLLLSELFGHEKGAFTGANERKIGRFEKAHGGTLFLDEIGEIAEEGQVKLLRVLQNGEFERVGGTKTLRVNVRLICATNKNLAEEVRNGRFREDLFYRINVIRLDVPPLRERRNDIGPLIHFFIQYYARLNNKSHLTIDESASAILLKYDWPGNVRELKNVIERMVVLCNQKVLCPSSIPLDIRDQCGIPAPGESAPVSSGSLQGLQIKDMEKDFIQKKLIETGGNKLKAAKELGIARKTLYRKIKEYGIS